MRINRQKRVNKLLSFYANNFGFRKPYQVLIDGTFCHVALKSKVNIKDQLPKYLQGEVKFLTTQCVILEVEKLGPSVYGAMLIVKQFAVHKCGHEKHPKPGAVCLESMLGTDNPSRYILATQDRDLQTISERIPGVPIMFIHQKAPTIQEPSRVCMNVAQDSCRRTFKLNKSEAKVLKVLKKCAFGPQEPQPLRRKKKKKGGPNPLSCKKKQKKPPQQQPNKPNQNS